MLHSGWNSFDRPGRGRRRTRHDNWPKGRRTSTPGPSIETSSSEEFGDELTEYTYHLWLKALQREDRKQRKCVRFKKRHNPTGPAIPSSSSPCPPTTTSPCFSPCDILPSNAAFQPMFVPHLPVRSDYIMSYTYRPSENPARLVFIRPSPLYLPPPNTALHCCPLLGCYQNGTIGVVPYAYYCFYM